MCTAAEDHIGCNFSQLDIQKMVGSDFDIKYGSVLPYINNSG